MVLSRTAVTVGSERKSKSPCLEKRETWCTRPDSFITVVSSQPSMRPLSHAAILARCGTTYVATTAPETSSQAVVIAGRARIMTPTASIPRSRTPRDLGHPRLFWCQQERETTLYLPAGDRGHPPESIYTLGAETRATRLHRRHRRGRKIAHVLQRRTRILDEGH